MSCGVGRCRSLFVQLRLGSEITPGKSIPAPRVPHRRWMERVSGPAKPCGDLCSRHTSMNEANDWSPEPWHGGLSRRPLMRASRFRSAMETQASAGGADRGPVAPARGGAAGCAWLGCPVKPLGPIGREFTSPETGKGLPPTVTTSVIPSWFHRRRIRRRMDASSSLSPSGG